MISTGGRMMLDPHNVASLSRNGRVFCLVATPDEIFDRVVNDRSHDRASAPVGTGSSAADRRAARRTQSRLSPLRAAHHRRRQRRRRRLGPHRAWRRPILTVLRSTTRAATMSTRSARRSCRSFVSWRGSRGRWCVVTNAEVGSLYLASCGDVDLTITLPAGQRPSEEPGGRATRLRRLARCQRRSIGDDRVARRLDRRRRGRLRGGDVLPRSRPRALPD